MIDEKKIDPRRGYVLEFCRLLRRWRDANLNDFVRIRLAVEAAQAKHPLTPQQQRDVDEFLKEKMKSRWREVMSGRLRGTPVEAGFSGSAARSLKLRSSRMRVTRLQTVPC